MKKNIIIIITVVVLVVIASIYTRSGFKTTSSKLSVVASFYPLADFAEEIGGNTVTVQTIVPAGIEPHDYEPTPNDIINTRRADLFIYNGGGFDVWAEKLARNIGDERTRALNVSEKFLTTGTFSNTLNPDHFNPHLWLNPLYALKEVELIRDALIERNPNMRTFYEDNAQIYSQKLRALDQKYEEGLRSCALRDIIVSHAAFEYLGSRYTINVIPIAGITPEEEPSPRKIGEITQIVRAKGIRYIFFETAVSPRLAETIARESGAGTLVLNPIETLTDEEKKKGEDYLSIMEINLRNLQKALVCNEKKPTLN